MMLPKLMSLNSVNFDFSECSFNDADNNKKDLKGDSRWTEPTKVPKLR